MFVVGCPVRARAWILDQWADHVLTAAMRAGVGVTLAFVLPNDDEETLRALASLQERTGVAVQVTRLAEPPLLRPEHNWSDVRHYTHMAEIRNVLLGMVRQMQPERFWSVDSDILVHPDTLTSALSLTDRFDVVGSKCYMTENSRDNPSWGAWHPGAGGIRRYDSDGQFEVDIVMAIKLMSPGAYGIDYAHHHQGEDVAWSFSCREAGLKLGWDGSITSRHVHRRELLDVDDPRCTPIEVGV